VFEDRTDVAEADKDGGGRDEKYEIKALRKTVGHEEKEQRWYYGKLNMMN